jgi:hypothetical protein
VSPLVDESGRAIVLIELRSPDGEAVLHAPAEGLAAFLQSTYAIVAPGGESGHVDLDVLVEELRRSGGPAL